MRKYRNKDDNLMKIRLLEMDCCMKFVNSDILNQPINEYLITVNNYCWFVARKDHIELDPFIMWQAMTKSLRPLMDVSNEMILEHKEFLISLRDHLKIRLDSLKDGFEIEGKLKVGFHYYQLSSLFIVPELLKPYTEEFFLDIERKRIDEKIFHLIYDLNFEYDRIKKCLKCDNYFYQPTKRLKRYCNQRCAGAVRQQRHYEGNK
jgi:hypothetical protein